MLKDYTPVENGSKKELSGDAVCQVAEVKQIVSKKGGEYIVFKANAINCLNDAQGRPTTISVGDEVVKFYDVAKPRDVQQFSNDMFTAGLELDKSSEQAFLVSLLNMTDKLVYMRTWMQVDKVDPTKRYQRLAIKSKSMLTPENSTPNLKF
jgi:hypothetical protein